MMTISKYFKEEEDLLFRAGQRKSIEKGILKGIEQGIEKERRQWRQS